MKIHGDLREGMEPFPGFRLIRLRGRGAFAEVWEAGNDKGEKLAFKFMSGADDRTTAAEIRAIQAFKQLQHSKLIRLEQVWCWDSFIVLSMELADKSLQDIFEVYLERDGTAMPPKEACMYLSQAAEGIDFLNAKKHRIHGQLVGYQHCDIKPSNILLLGNEVKLTDYGLAVPTSTRSKAHKHTGTLDFAAPEVFQSRLSEHTDQYSLAVTYCLIRGGEFPFPAINAFRASWPMRRPPADLSMLSPAEQPIVAKSLTRVPQDRWPSCKALMAELTRVVG